LYILVLGNTDRGNCGLRQFVTICSLQKKRCIYKELVDLYEILLTLQCIVRAHDLTRAGLNC